jgi:hypothetical protein
MQLGLHRRGPIANASGFGGNLLVGDVHLAEAYARGAMDMMSRMQPTTSIRLLATLVAVS